jgi:hypothetical protein
MRITALTLLALLAAACAPPASQDAPPAASAAAAPVNPDTAALGANPATGAWTFHVAESVSAAGFGLPESEYQFIIACDGGKLSLSNEAELTPDQDTTMRIITATQSIELPARSFNEGLPTITTDLAAADPLKPLLIGMLGAPTDRFAVEIAGVTQVFPWDDEIAQALTACS